MSWIPDSISRVDTYSEREGWHNSLHHVVPGEQVGMYIRIKGRVTSVPCTLTIGFLGAFGAAGSHVIAQRSIGYSVGDLDVSVVVYGIWDPHGVPACHNVDTDQYVYDIETGSRVEDWDAEVFHCAPVEVVANFADLQAVYT